MRTVTIIGYGRFGKTLQRLLQGDFRVTVYVRNVKPLNTRMELDSPSTSVSGTSFGRPFVRKLDTCGNDKLEVNNEMVLTDSLEEAYSSEVIFYAVPISSFESVLKEHKKYIRDEHVLVDVLSVKEYPKKVFEKHLRGMNTQALLTHPMFGPDSGTNGFVDLPIILDKFKVTDGEYLYWQSYFSRKGLRVIEMSAREHDRLAAESLGVTHFIGRVLEHYQFKDTSIDSLGTSKLHEVTRQTTNDTWELFTDLQHYNPHTERMRLKIGEAYDAVYNVLLPQQRNKRYITLGIQGGRGSFNEEAIQDYVISEQIKKYKIRYLYTSEQVLRSLHTGEIDRGQFAIHNSVGGIVGESIEAMAKYKFVIEKEFAIQISHALMIRPDADISDITTIMTHPQVLAQCKSTLLKKFPDLVQTSGMGELVDHSKVAKFLAEGKLPKTIAVMGSKVLRKLYGLKIVEDNLQDAKENWTSFLVVSRI